MYLFKLFTRGFLSYMIENVVSDCWLDNTGIYYNNLGLPLLPFADNFLNKSVN